MLTTALSSSGSSPSSSGNSNPIPIPSSFSAKRKNSNAKYKPCNLSITKASRTPKQFEVPDEFYKYNSLPSSSMPNMMGSTVHSVGSLLSGDEMNGINEEHLSPPHLTSKNYGGNPSSHAISIQPAGKPFSKASSFNTMASSANRQFPSSSSTSTSQAMPISNHYNRHEKSASSVSSFNSSFIQSLGSHNPTPNSLTGHYYPSGYFNPHSLNDNSSVCCSLSSSVESSCSYASQCYSPNSGSFVHYDKSSRKFKKIKSLGEGSSSTVTLVQQESSGMYFAEKVIEEYEERESIVKNEVKFLSVCKNCNNIVTLYDCFQKGNTIHLILEYMEGNSLDLIAKQYCKAPKSNYRHQEGLGESISSPMAYEEAGSFPFEEFDEDMDDDCHHALFPMDDSQNKTKSKRSSVNRRLFDDEEELDSAKNINDSKGIPDEILAMMTVQIVRALCFIHESNIIHSDIKPSNILLNKRGEVKLTDFGLSTYADVSHNRQGSFAYMSPEKLHQGKHSSKSDIYSLGISILELSKCKFPFSESGFHMNEISNLDVDKFVGKTHSVGFKDFVKKCIQIDPHSRYSAQELLHHNWLQSYASMDVETLCSKVSRWYLNNNFVSL